MAGRGADTKLRPRSGTVQPVLPSPAVLLQPCSLHCTSPHVGQARAGEPCAAAPRPEAAMAARRAALPQSRMSPGPLSAAASQQRRSQQHPRLQQQAARRRARRAATATAASPLVHLPTLWAGCTAAPSTCLAGESWTCPNVLGALLRPAEHALVSLHAQGSRGSANPPTCRRSCHTLPADSCMMSADRSCTSR